MSDGKSLVLRPIGRVSKGSPNPRGSEPWEEKASEIEIDTAWANGLDGIEEFSHLWIVWWFDQLEHPPESTHVRPEGRADMPLIGLFATRTPHRPNPIAITAVRLLEREGAWLRVEGLDACQGTPILDIKPYLSRGDLLPDATTPGWLARLWRLHDGELES